MKMRWLVMAMFCGSLCVSCVSSGPAKGGRHDHKIVASVKVEPGTPRLSFIAVKRTADGKEGLQTVVASSSPAGSWDVCFPEWRRTVEFLSDFIFVQNGVDVDVPRKSPKRSALASRYSVTSSIGYVQEINAESAVKLFTVDVYTDLDKVLYSFDVWCTGSRDYDTMSSEKIVEKFYGKQPVKTIY